MDRQLSGGKTLLMHAATSGRIDYVKTLLYQNADVNILDENGNTAEELAIKSGNSEIASLLLTATHSNSWNEFVSTEKSVKMMLNELHNGKTLDGLLNSLEYAPLKNRIVNESANDLITWFRASDNIRIGFDANYYVRWMINDHQIESLW